MAFYLLHTKCNLPCCDFDDLGTDAMRAALKALAPHIVGDGRALSLETVNFFNIEDFVCDRRIMFAFDGTPHWYRDNADWTELRYYAPDSGEVREIRPYSDLPNEAFAHAIGWMLKESMLPEPCERMDVDSILSVYSIECLLAANDNDLLFTVDGHRAFRRSECRAVEYPPMDV